MRPRAPPRSEPTRRKHRCAQIEQLLAAFARFDYDQRTTAEELLAMEKAEFFRDARRDLPGPLRGVRVLELTTTWAGPLCGCLLADFGADVVKIELPEGEVARRIPPFLPGLTKPVSFVYATVNRNKRSLTLDVRTPDGRDVFLRLVEKADVVVENFRPGTAEAWGVGYAAARERNHDIVYVSISAFGQFGPDFDQPGYDPIAQAASGFLSLAGPADGAPVKAPTFLGDDLAGLHGAFGALAALRHRDQTGEGQHVDVALVDALLFQSNGLLTLGALGIPLKRFGNEYGSVVPANLYPCRDGFVYIGSPLDTHWQALARAMGRPELGGAAEYASAAARAKRRAEVNRLVSAWTAELPLETVVDRCRNEGVPVAAVRSYAEAACDPHVRARDMLQDVVQAEGSTAPITGPAVKFSRSPVRIRAGAPALGAHVAEILGEIGLDADAIGDLRRRGIV